MAWIKYQWEPRVAMEELCDRVEEFSTRTKGKVYIDCYDQNPGYARLYFEKTGAVVADIMKEIRALGFKVRRTLRK